MPCVSVCVCVCMYHSFIPIVSLSRLKFIELYVAYTAHIRLVLAQAHSTMAYFPWFFWCFSKKNVVGSHYNLGLLLFLGATQLFFSPMHGNVARIPQNYWQLLSLLAVWALLHENRLCRPMIVNNFITRNSSLYLHSTTTRVIRCVRLFSLVSLACCPPPSSASSSKQ